MPDHDTYQGGQFSTLFSPIPWTFFHAVLHRAYYAWTKQPETTEKTKENEKLETKIRQIFDAFKQT